MGESLVQRLEQFSYYERLSEHGGEAERTVFIFRNIDIRGKAYHVLSRIKDAPADYTGRTNFIAQHLVFTPDEAANMPTPAALLNHWSGWKDQWEQEPRLFANESWAEFDELKRRTFLPAKHWFTETADYGRAAALLGLNAGVFTAHDFRPKLILDLLSESLELLQLEGPNWRSLAWQRTFSVGCQPQDNPADFRWRFLTSGLPFESSVTQGRAPLDLRRLRAPSNSQQVQFAQKGPSPPQFTRLPRAGETIPLNEGETLILDGEAQSLPGPSIYRWYRVEKDNVTLQEIDGAHGAKLEIPNSQRGKHRYKVRAWDSITDQYAESPLIVVEVKEKVKIPSLSGRPIPTAGSVSPSSGASKPVRQLQLKKESTYSSRTSESSLGDELVEEVSPRFYQAHANRILIASVLFSLAGLTAAFLQFMEFFEPRFKNNKDDWWALKVTKNPLAFENSQRISKATKQKIAEYRPNKKDQNKRDHLLKIIDRDIQDNQGMQGPVSLPSPGVHKPPTVVAHPETTENNAPKQQPIMVPGPMHVILADTNWTELFTHLETTLKTQQTKKQTAEKTYSNATNEVALATQQAKANKANTALQTATAATNALAQAEQKITIINNLLAPLKKSREESKQITFPKVWPYFPTNTTPPTLRWVSPGQANPDNNSIPGQWRTNEWNFEAGKWSLNISPSGAVYKSNNEPGVLLVVISMEENADGTNDRLRLLLFSTNTSKRFQLTLDGDDVNPSADLKQLLSSIALQSSRLRIMGNYPNVNAPMSNTLHDIHEMNERNQPWKLGIKAQLASDGQRAEKLKQITNAFAHIESFWLKVSKDNILALRGVEDFQKAVDPTSELRDGALKRAFWEKLDLLCLVSIYKREEPDKALKLEGKNAADARKMLVEYIGTPEEGNSQFRDELMQVVKHLDYLQDFWKRTFEEREGKTTLFGSKSYKEVKTKLSQQIEELERHGGTIKPADLRITLEFQAFRNTWIPITRLDASNP